MAKGISNTARTLEYIRSQGRDSLGRFTYGSKGHSMPHSEESKKKISMAGKGKRTSPKTEFKKGMIPWNKGLKKAQKPYWLGKKRSDMTGDKHPGWKGGTTSTQTKIRNSLQMKKWREGVFKRDNYTCVLCGDNGKIEADHLYPFFRMFEESPIKSPNEIFKCNAFWDINNGRTLCVLCHRKVKNEGYLRKNTMTPTQRTIKYLKDQEMKCDIVEQWLKNPKHPAGGQRKDLFGIIDIIALTERGIAGIQSCGQNFAEHDQKILAEPLALKWLEKGGALMLIGWRKVKLSRGGKAMRWQPRIKEYSEKDFRP